MQAVIVFESVFGTTERAARLIGDELHRHGVPTRIFSAAVLDQPEVAQAIAAADLVVVGTWTDGFVLVGQRPGRTGLRKPISGKFKDLPDLTGKRAVVFCTYAVNPGGAVKRLTRKVEACGAEVLGGMSIHRHHVPEGAVDLVERTLGVVPA